MNKLKCPFCGQELKNHLGGDMPEVWCCDNEKCKLQTIGGDIELWQELTRTRKALDVAVDALKYANKCIKGGCINWETEIDKALEQITVLEQKDAK